ncbi:hypothetical protein PENTCL1PPCAC_16526, partial [Pristionchus entomophagus]
FLTPGSRYLLKPRTRVAGFIVVLILNPLYVTICLDISFRPAGTVHEYQKSLSSEWSQDLIDRADCVDSHRILAFAGSSAVLLPGVLLFIFAISAHTLAQLQKSSAISDKMREFHRTMTKVLMFQAAVPQIFIVIPLTGCFGTFLLRINGMLILPLCLTIISAHSFLHSLALLSTTPIYRHTIMRFFGRCILKMVCTSEASFLIRNSEISSRVSQR